MHATNDTLKGVRTSSPYRFVPLVVSITLVFAFCSALYLREAHQIAFTNLDNENRRLDRFVGLFGRDIGSTISDLRLLASGDGFQAYISDGRPDNLERAVRRAFYFSTENPDYDQIRFIDETGREVFRVNQNGVVVAQANLQDKGDRPFFQKANNLPPGEIYVSPIDLNVENNAIEHPLKPTLRVAMPIFGPDGRRRGIYVINYLAANSIGRLKAFVPRYAQRLRILNSQGYWIAGAKPDEEWGFQLPDRSGLTMAKSDPELWAKIIRQPSGQEPYRGGYFTWKYAVPRDFYPNKPVSLVAGDDFLVFASVVSGAEWSALFAELRQTFVIVALILLILAVALNWIYQARRRATLERDRFFNLTRELLCIAGFDGYFKRVNPAWRNTLGYTAEEMMMKPFIEFVHPEDRQKTIEQSANLAHGGEVISFENRYRCKDGSYRWLLWSARSLVEEQLIYASARDLTDRKQIEEKLRESEERVRLMIESVKDYAIFMLDPSGRVMSWNAGAERIHGYPAREIIGQHFSRFYPEDRKQQRNSDADLLAAAADGQYEDEGWRMRRDGTKFWANDIITAMRAPQGELLGFVKVSRDVTARKETAEKIDRLNAELNQRASLLEVANKELESFSYSVSHDLRAPLRHIHGFVELLQKSPALENDKSAQRYMNVITRAARDMGLLIDDLLTLSRTGRAEMHPVLIDMPKMVNDVIRDLEMDLKDRSVTWDIKPMHEALGDPGLIRLVWLNLIGNAIKYTRPREVAKIEIGEATKKEANSSPGEWIYYVRDNGVGFDQQYAPKVFGVFQRLHRAEDFEGTGIGLANVQRIIHRHGGRVWAEGKVDAGATFFFSLPVTKPSA